jgi:hypothetical protein
VVHTSGDWYCEGELTNGRASIYVMRWSEQHPICDEGDELVIADVTDEEVGETEALGNAHLIAAAPTLLATLKAIMAAHLTRTLNADLVKKARAAIAKAEGGA